MKRHVVDASVLAGALIESQRVPEAVQLFSPTAVVVAPEFLRHEIANAFRQLLRRWRITVEDIQRATRNLDALGIEYIDSRDLTFCALELTNHHNLPAIYDSIYPAAAEALDCELWTSDSRFARAVRQKGRPLVRLYPVWPVVTAGSSRLHSLPLPPAPAPRSP
ncbi:MAG: type II toxin-antitoxin system VapC family toxin [Chloroflexi bacterium]|nr:type II toxin-antitoxin system VapC family toxin [Chloroflexota bacterium]